MQARQVFLQVSIGLATLVTIMGAGCATPQTRTVEPLFTEMPKMDTPAEPRLLKVPAPPPLKAIPLVIKIPKKATTVSAENAVMRRGATIKAGSSVVISMPSVAQRQLDDAARSKETAAQGGVATTGFRTDGYFNMLENCSERELTSVGLFVKDRSKFEAKLRDLHDGITPAKTAAGSENTQSVGGLSPFKNDGELKRQELYDLPELIRAAQDGEVMADYILQVSDLSVRPYTGEPLQLSTRPEVQAVLNEAPGLRVGGEKENGDSIPATLNQPWMTAHFNAKLINVKTGTIDWIGDYNVESLSVLDDGMTILIGIRRLTENAKAIVSAITAYNDQLSASRRDALETKGELQTVYVSAMESVQYQGEEYAGVRIQNERKERVTAAEQAYAKKLRAYSSVWEQQPPEAKMDWTYYYVVDQPVANPDLANTKTEKEAQRLAHHIQQMVSKLTRDLFSTIKVSE